MKVSSGDRLGPYEIVSLLGTGGMGEVWQARDTRLQRDVAVKVSAEQFSERFEREARVIASLNHPNICTLHDVGPDYLVMELVEGPTLSDRLKEGALPLAEALEIARQIAHALEAAHEKGVTHRDLKPANIKITPDGRVKVLDFGLAKEVGTAAASVDSPTMTMSQTGVGMILGTAGYMSPEQAKGKPVDKRADIWAFGVVLYEMVTGERTFGGDTLTELLAAVLKEEPQWNRAPQNVQPLLKRCLEKDPRKRLRDIGDAMFLVQDTHAAEAAPSRSWFSSVAWGLAGVGLLSTAILAVIHFREKPPAPLDPVRFQIASTDLSNANDFYMPISPDGRKIAYTANSRDGMRRLWVRDMNALEPRMLAGTENAVSPFWSPDSKYLAFGVGTSLKKADASGASPPQTLCEATNAVGIGAWNREGVIIFGARGAGPIQRVAASGGIAVPVTALAAGDVFHTFPAFLPDGHHFIFLRAGNMRGIYAGSLDTKQPEQPSKRIMESPLGVLFAPGADPMSGHLLFLRGSTLMAQPFNARRLELVGEAVPIVERVASAGSGGWYSVSSNGALAYRMGSTNGTSQLTWYDRKGNSQGRVGEPAAYSDLAISRDGTRLASYHPAQQNDIWLYEFERGVNTRLTFDPALDRYPVWSPDGNRIAFSSTRQRFLDLYVKSSNGAGEEKVLLSSQEGKRATDWSRDGRFLLYMQDGAHTRVDVWVLPMEGPDGKGKPVPLLQTPFQEAEATFSPDTRWVAYTSDESGRLEVYVRPFLAAGPSGAPELGEGKWQISKDGATGTWWRNDGKELLFLGRDGMLSAVEVSTAPTFHVGPPQPLFRLPAGTVAVTGSADAKRFLLAVPAEPERAEPITVMLNWEAALRK